MESAEPSGAKYVVPRYRAEGDPAWYHVLHGTVPGHQIDFMYCPDVPQGRLTQTHFGHLSRLMKYIEPREGAPYAFALGNLSRDDVQHEPGHGGLALIFALRVAGVTDHAGRTMLPYAHGVLAIDRELDYGALLDAIAVFYRRFHDADAEQREDATGSFYRAYVHTMREHPEAVEDLLHGYVADFDELPQPPRSQLGLEWEADEETLPKRITIVHADDERFETLAHAAANIAAMLYKSNIKWTSITSGREIEIPGGVSIRFLPASEAPRDRRQTNPRRTASQDFRVLAARDPQGLQVSLQDLPQEEAALAHLLFGARPRATETKAPRATWRQALGLARPENGSASGNGFTSGNNPVPVAAPPSNRPPAPPVTPPSPDGAGTNTLDVSFDDVPTQQAPLEGDPAAPAFDPRRSSPAGGVASAFDPRRSSPTTGVAGVSTTAGELPRSAVPLEPVAGAGNRSAPATPLLDSIPPPSLDSASVGSPHSGVVSEARSRLGIWIGVIGGIAVIVAIAVAVATGGGAAATSGSASDPGSASGAVVPPPQTAEPSGAPVTTATGTTASAPTATSSAESASPPATASATTPPATTNSGTTKSTSGGKVKKPGGLRGPLRVPK